MSPKTSALPDPGGAPRSRWRLGAAMLAALPVILSTALVPVSAQAAPAPDNGQVSQDAAGEAPQNPSTEPGTAPSGPLDGVLVSEVANGGPGGGVENFIELTNYGSEPEDISGWRIYRCGQSGDGYGPQVIVPEGTSLAPGEQYTVVRQGSPFENEPFADATYDVTLHSFGFGAWIMDAEEQTRDRIGRYHESIHSQCGNPGGFDTLQDQVSWAHAESIQRVDTTGDIHRDWIVGERTPGAPNTTEPSVITADRAEVGDILITEYAPGGPGGYNEDFIELANAGETAVDISGWKVWRCGDNSQTYSQSDGLPAGSVLQPGETFLLARSGSSIAGEADVTYGTSVHWINSGAMVLTPDEKIVDRMSMYGDHRVSPCTDGTPKAYDINVLTGESYQRVSDTGDNAADFVAALRTPGEWPAPEDLEPVEVPASAHAGEVWITELIADGPAGGSDEFIEITNTGSAPVDTSGWSLYRCEGTGRMAPSPQIADLGVTLQPGQTYLAAPASAPAALRELADGTYATGLNHADGYGAVLFDQERARVDGVGVYDTIPVEHCGTGLTLQNNVRADEGLTYQRAVFDGEDSYHEFVKAERTPGEYVEHEWRDETVPLPGQTDPVSVDRAYRPGTPLVEDDGAEATEEGFRTSVRTEHEGDRDLQVSFRSAAPVAVNQDATGVWSGTTAGLPETLQIDGEESLAADDSLVSEGHSGEYPFQRFEITVEEVPEEGLEVVWTGQTQDRNEIQLYGWDLNEQAWLLLDAAQPSHDGDLTLIGRASASMVDGETVNVLVLDGPRTTGGLFDEVGVVDQEFAQPGTYDLAFNHMTDTQFYSEGFVSVFTDMVAWVIANQDARDIAYSTNTGDIIENWMRGFDDPERARREFRDAAKITQLLNEHGVANGVLPGNHDNFWGRNNDLYNEYFGPEMFEDQPWWGNSWQPGDNSAHYDWFIHDDGTKFLVLNLQYNPSDAQLEWANAVAEANQDWNIILATHSYLHTSGEVDDIERRHSARANHIWEKVIVPNDNIFLVVGGHYHGVATNYADPITGERVNVSELPGETAVIDNVGAEGRRVVEMLADYQGYRSSQPDPRADTYDRDTGFQRLLQFDLDAGLMAVNAYSPTLDDFEAWKYDEPAFRGDDARYGPEDDEFVVQVDLVKPTSFATQAWTVQGTASEEAVVEVAAGETAVHDWSADDAGLAWYSVTTAVEETAADDAQAAAARAPEGAFLESLLAQQSAPRAEAGPYPQTGSAPAAGDQDEDGRDAGNPGDDAAPREDDGAAEDTGPAEGAAVPEDGRTAEPTSLSGDSAGPEDRESETDPSAEPGAPGRDEAAEDEAPSGTPAPEPGTAGVRALNEPVEVTGESVVSFPRLLGEASDPGEPGDPGTPDPGEPTDPGQPDPGTPDPDPSDPGDPGQPGEPSPEPSDPGQPGGEPSGEPTDGGPDGGADAGGDAGGPGAGEPGAGPGAGDGKPLPRTGAETAAMIASALLLLALGGGALYAARRRKGSIDA
ncbi:lamin tail domain-containing protein [Sediminivirga luteola]|uniref:LTD domain-containing protein n=1 Tax=Sediminivirga luteola TaxID=1774748 RepID=A0A8J2XKC3_9MICO|nr:lamin tail domain-containing protein [Sediminivirga luteola]GGA27013.1 hypothetical protein GCM10011333_32290 [Sediminivirga luteola]